MAILGCPRVTETGPPDLPGPTRKEALIVGEGTLKVSYQVLLSQSPNLPDWKRGRQEEHG